MKWGLTITTLGFQSIAPHSVYPPKGHPAAFMAGNNYWITFSFIMTFVYNISKGNIVPAVIMHAIFNSSPFVLNAFLANAKTRDFISTELLLALSFLFIAAILLMFTRGRLGQGTLESKRDIIG